MGPYVLPLAPNLCPFLVFSGKIIFSVLWQLMRAPSWMAAVNTCISVLCGFPFPSS